MKKKKLAMRFYFHFFYLVLILHKAEELVPGMELEEIGEEKKKIKYEN